MNIEVFSHENPNDCRIYKDVIVYSIDGKNEFRVFDAANLSESEIDFSYENYNWRELTLDEERLYGISSNNYEEPYVIGSRPFNQSLVCSDCEKVIFIGNGKKLGNIVEVDADNISKIESIEVNGIKFKKV